MFSWSSQIQMLLPNNNIAVHAEKKKKKERKKIQIESNCDIRIDLKSQIVDLENHDTPNVNVIKLIYIFFL